MILIASLACALSARAELIDESIRDLRASDPKLRAAAEQTLVEAGAEAVPALVESLGDSRARRVVLPVLAKMRKAAIPKLIELLDREELRSRAGEALFQLATPDSRDQAPALLSCLKKPSLTHFCGQALVRVVDGRSRARVPELLEALKSRDKDVRMYSAAALGQIGGAAKAAVPPLVEALKDREPPVRSSAAAALGKMGRKAVSALPALEEAAGDKDSEVRSSAVAALRKIKG